MLVAGQSEDSVRLAAVAAHLVVHEGHHIRADGGTVSTVRATSESSKRQSVRCGACVCVCVWVYALHCLTGRRPAAAAASRSSRRTRPSRQSPGGAKPVGGACVLMCVFVLYCVCGAEREREREQRRVSKAVHIHRFGSRSGKAASGALSCGLGQQPYGEQCTSPPPPAFRTANGRGPHAHARRLSVRNRQTDTDSGTSRTSRRRTMVVGEREKTAAEADCREGHAGCMLE